jgi:pimeloyl-ACP methyl ester carboxylesterase
MKTRRLYVDCDFGQLHITHADVAIGQTPVIVLLNSRPRSLLPVLPLLNSDFHGVIVDIPGLGLSSPPPSGASMFDIANGIANVLDAFDTKRAHIFGMHTGAKVAVAFASSHPARVGKLIVAGKTHSIVVGQDARNTAVKNCVAKRPLDVAIVQTEGKYLDDLSQQAGSEAIYAANFAFDMDAEMANVEAEMLVLEVVTDEEDNLIGRQGLSLASQARKGHSIVVPQTDSTGLDMYIGVRKINSIIRDFLLGATV